MFRVLKTKRFAVAIGVVGALTAAGFAFAYFTSSGSGTGTATVGSTQGLVIHGTATGILYPGATSPVTFTVDNGGGGPEQLSTISLTNVAACSSAWGGSTGDVCNNNSNAPGTGDISGCGGQPNTSSSDFSMADVPVDAEIATGSHSLDSVTGVLKMNDLSTSQDACKGAHLLLKFGAAAPAN